MRSLTSPPQSCLIIGGGITGLIAGTVLQRQGIAVTIVDKGRGIGGRLATRRLQHPTVGEGIFDYGMQFFAVRDRCFQVWVDDWLAQGVVVQWSRQLSRSGQPVYRGTESNRSIARHLAKDLDVHNQQRVTELQWQTDHWLAHTQDGSTFTAQSLIITAPVPQTVDLLAESAIAIPAEPQQRLKQVQYSPCIALLVLLDGPSAIAPPGGVKGEGDVLAWLACNQTKGISQTVAVTLHAMPEFSHAHLNAEDAVIRDRLLTAATPWLGSSVVATHVHRWRYSQPQTFFGQPCLALSEPGLLVMAGDAFAPMDSTKSSLSVERAVLSGLSAAASVSGTVAAGFT